MKILLVEDSKFLRLATGRALARAGYEIIFAGDGDEALLRASGVIARIALERHLFTVAEVRGISVTVNPPSKKNPDEEDLLTALVRSNVITAVKKIHVASHWCPVTSRADSAG